MADSSSYGRGEEDEDDDDDVVDETVSTIVTPCEFTLMIVYRGTRL